MNYKLYTDGSHFKSGKRAGRLGCGGVLVNDENKKIASFSLELDPDFLYENYGTRDCSNPTTELLGVLVALTKFREFIKPGDRVLVIADYIGVKSWMKGAWKTREAYISKIKSEIDEEIKDQNLKNRIDFAWVKGHQQLIKDKDAFWNNYVDRLAKGEIEK